MGTSPGSQAVVEWDGTEQDHGRCPLPVPWTWGCPDKAVPNAALALAIFWAGNTVQAVAEGCLMCITASQLHVSTGPSWEATVPLQGC